MPKNTRPRQFEETFPGFHLEAQVAKQVRWLAAHGGQDLSYWMRRALKHLLETGLTPAEQAIVENFHRLRQEQAAGE